MTRVQQIRVSIGSAAVLGLKSVKVETEPTTCYVMTKSINKCEGACLFCPQGKNSASKNAERLSRINWPIFSMKDFLEKLDINQYEQNLSNKHPKFQRLCIQVLNYSDFYEDVENIIEKIKNVNPKLPISAAIPPISKKKMEILKNLGLERICFALDACTSPLFKKIKGVGAGGPYDWEDHHKYLKHALSIFGEGLVTTHYIVGLGETEKEMIEKLFLTIKSKILPGIFLFTPVKGTPMENNSRPNINQFRRIQISRYLLLKNIDSFERFQFNESGELIKITKLTHAELQKIVEKQIAFKTAGCPGCNRPYYTAKPGEEQDGYPRDLTLDEKDMIFSELENLIDK